MVLYIQRNLRKLKTMEVKKKHKTHSHIVTLRKIKVLTRPILVKFPFFLTLKIDIFSSKVEPTALCK
jgi:hypothetical protein